MSPEERRPDPDEGTEAGEESSGPKDQPTEESFARQAGLSPDESAPEAGDPPDDGSVTDEGPANDEGPATDEGPITDEFFEGVPPEQLHGEGGEGPDLEPEFRDALREAARPPVDPGIEPPGQETAEYVLEEEQPGEPEPEQPQSEETAEPEQPGERKPEPAAPGAAPGAGDGTAGKRPQEVAPKPVRNVVIGAGEAKVQDEAPAVEDAAVEAPPAAPAKAATAAAPPAGKPAVASSATPGMPQRPGPDGDPEPPPRGPRIWLKFLLGSMIIILTMAVGTAMTGVKYLDDFATALGHGGKLHNKLKDKLASVEGGQPQNILILGSDKRAGAQGAGDPGRSDTTILLRLDPDQHTISLMSIPRDLKVYLGPNLGTGKFNDAYAYGGPEKTLRVVKRITGLPINHVVNVDFLGFVRAVDAIGCVWTQVDRRYYHSNAGLPASLQYAEINIQPGYQKLCGKDALEYVRYRHTDTDLVRAARQQDFLREARQRVSPTELFFTKRDELLTIFTQYTTSDISEASSAEDVLKLLVASRGSPIKEVHFPGILGPSYVTASPGSIQAAVGKFLGGAASGGPRGTLETPTNNTGIGPEDKKFKKHPPAPVNQPKAPKTPTPANDGLIDASSGSHQVSAPIAKKVGPGFPVFYPRRLPSGSVYLQTRTYHMHDPDKDRHQAYSEILQLPAGDYFDVQGVSGWGDPPILKSPSETRSINGRDYDIYLDGDRVRMIAWHEGDNSYWIYNSLLQTLSNEQMLGMARSIGEIKPPAPKHRKP